MSRPGFQTLADIRARALAYVAETDTSSFYGSTMLNYWANDALKRWYLGISDGVEDIWSTTTVIGQREYPCPAGFLKPKQVLYNGDPLRHTQFITLDFFSSGNSYVGWFGIWGWPEPRLLLGPLPPSAAYRLDMYHYRSPMTMTNDTDIPELPQAFVHYLSFYVAAQIKLADGDGQIANMMMSEYNAGRDEYRRQIVDNSASNYMSVIHEVD